MEEKTIPSLSAAVTQVVSRFETRFGYVGGQQNRGGNILRAASQVDGLVLMPGQIVSFNEHVGPRSKENGFFPAPEIYKGEMREGIGGGTCQVAGTLHAAAFFGGLNANGMTRVGPAARSEPTRGTSAARASKPGGCTSSMRRPGCGVSGMPA